MEETTLLFSLYVKGMVPHFGHQAYFLSAESCMSGLMFVHYEVTATVAAALLSLA